MASIMSSHCCVNLWQNDAPLIQTVHPDLMRIEDRITFTLYPSPLTPLPEGYRVHTSPIKSRLWES